MARWGSFPLGCRRGRAAARHSWACRSLRRVMPTRSEVSGRSGPSKNPPVCAEIRAQECDEGRGLEMVAAEHMNAVSWLSRPEGRVAYEVAGTGPLVVCVPG